MLKEPDFTPDPYETDHWGSWVFPTNLDWKELACYTRGYLVRIGHIGVDSASVKVEISIGDLCPTFNRTYAARVFTPEGDGSYSLLAGTIPKLGRVLIVAFDLDEEDDGYHADPQPRQDCK